MLTPPGRAPGVRRLNRVPIAIGCCVVAVVVSAVGYTAYQRSEQNKIADTEEKTASKAQSGKTPGFLANTNSTVDTRQPAKLSPESKTAPSAAPAATDSGLTVDEQARAAAWQAYYQAQAQAIAAHNALEQSAHSGLMDPLQGAGGNNAQVPGTAPPDPTAQPGAPGAAYSTGGVNPEGQTGKQAFLRTAGDVMGANEDLQGSLHGPKSNTIMEGTGIPIRLVEGATSDMPGQVNAEVMQNVYDTMTGDVLLIPQGTRVVGTYDIAVSNGQSRLGIIWQRLIFPDTSSRQIGSMSGADQAGLGGMKDLLDTHFWEKFGSAIMVSLIGAGAQLSQPQQSAFATPSSTSAAVGAMTQQMSQFGQEQARAGLAIPNTIELRPGLIGLIKVSKDIALPAYTDRRGMGSGRGNASMTVGKFIQ